MAWEIELEPEVDEWLSSLKVVDFAQATEIIDRLSEQGSKMRMPYSRSLGEGLFELRFHCENVARRVTFWFGPDRRIVLLTTFRKQRDNERREIERARVVMQRCEAEHMEEDR